MAFTMRALTLHDTALALQFPQRPATLAAILLPPTSYICYHGLKPFINTWHSLKKHYLPARFQPDTPGSLQRPAWGQSCHSPAPILPNLSPAFCFPRACHSLPRNRGSVTVCLGSTSPHPTFLWRACSGLSTGLCNLLFCLDAGQWENSARPHFRTSF